MGGFEDALRERWRSIVLGSGARRPAAERPDASRAPGGESPRSTTFIGAGAQLQGTLQLTGDFCIDSDFHGSLTTDGAVLVGASGSVQGEICAHEVVIEGAVVGNVTARRRVVLRSSARLHGDIETACLEIERHAFFQGRTTMTSPWSDHRPTPAVAAAGSGVDSR